MIDWLLSFWPLCWESDYLRLENDFERLVDKYNEKSRDAHQFKRRAEFLERRDVVGQLAAAELELARVQMIARCIADGVTSGVRLPGKGEET